MADNKLLDKLKYKDNYRFLVTNPPENFLNRLQGINFALQPEGKKYAIALTFVHSQAEIPNIAQCVINAADRDAILWFAYPKATGSIKSDINRDKGWDSLHENGYRPVSQIAIDGTWSALRFRHHDFVGTAKDTN